MKLSEIKGEQALDVLADLIEPIGRIATDEELVKRIQSGPQIFAVRKAVKDHKEDVLTILALLNGEDPKTYSPSIITIIKGFTDLLNDEEVQALFQSQEQTPTSSGSVTESTEAEM